MQQQSIARCLPNYLSYLIIQKTKQMLFNSKILQKIIKTQVLFPNRSVYAFNAVKLRDRSAVANQVNKKKSQKYAKNQIQEKQENQEASQQRNEYIRLQNSHFSQSTKHHQKKKVQGKTGKQPGLKLTQSQNIKFIYENCKAQQIIDQLRVSKEEQLANQLRNSFSNCQNPNKFLQLIAKASLRIDLSTNVQAIRQVLTNIMDFSQKQVIQNKAYFSQEISLEFINKYDQLILEILQQNFFSFSFYRYMNLYKNFLLNNPSKENELLSREVFKLVIKQMGRTDISVGQNLQALIDYLLKFGQQKHVEEKRQFLQLLGSNLAYFEAQPLKQCLIVIQLGEGNFAFSNNDVSNILEILFLYCQHYVKSLSLSELIKTIFSIGRLRHKNIHNYNRLHQLQTHYFKAILVQRKLNCHQISYLFQSFAARVVLADAEQPHFLKIVLTSLQNQLISIEKDNNKIVLSKINEIIKVSIFRKLFSYQLCKQQFKSFIEVVSAAITLAQRNQQATQFFNIKENLQNLEEQQQFKIIQRNRRINPQKLYLMLEKAIAKQDTKWLEDIIQAIVQLKNSFLYLPSVQYSTILPSVYSNYHKALEILYKKNKLKLVKKIISNVLHSQFKDTGKIKVIIKSISIWKESQTDTLWEFFLAIWLEAAAVQKKALVELSELFLQVMIWNLKNFASHLKHFSNPNFYQACTLIFRGAKSFKRSKKLQTLLDRFLCQILSRDYYSLLLDSFMNKVLDQITFQQLFQANQNKRLEYLLIWHKMKGIVTQDQISYFYKRANAKDYHKFSQLQQKIITYTYHFYVQEEQLPSSEQILLTLMENYHQSRWKDIQNVSSFQNVKEIGKELAQMRSKQLVSLLLSPLLTRVQPAIVKQVWNALLSRENQFQYLNWITLLESYQKNSLFANQELMLTLKIISYYSSKLDYLIFQDFQRLHNLIQQLQLSIQHSLFSSFFSDSFNYFLSTKDQRNHNINLLIRMLIKSKTQLTLKMGKTIIKAKSRKQGCIFLLWMEDIFPQQQYEELLNYYFQIKLSQTRYFSRLPYELELYFGKKYPYSLSSYQKYIMQSLPSKRDSFFQFQQVKSQLMRIQKSYQNIFCNYSYNFIIYQKNLLLFTDGTYQELQLKLFRKIAKFIPEAANKTFTQIIVNSIIDIQEIERKFSLKRKEVPIVSPDEEPDIKNLQYEKILAQKVAFLGTQFDKKESFHQNMGLDALPQIQDDKGV